MNKYSFFKSVLSALTVVLFASCDNDFNELGTDIVGINNFELGTKPYQVTAITQNIGAVESGNLPVNPLGIYDNPVFGLTKANLAVQVQLSLENPTINLDLAPDITSVILTIPYFNHKLATDADGDSTYDLDSIYGPDSFSKMKLGVYESSYFIRDINPIDQLSQAYYTDQNADFESSIVGSRLNNESSSQNDEFAFSNIETSVDTYTTAGVMATAKTAPAIKLRLSEDFFDAKIFHAPAGKLLNNNIFKDYFRGLYFKVDKNAGQDGNLAMLNIDGGNITINYTEYTSAINQTLVYKSIVLNFLGNTVSLIDQGNPAATPGADKLVLKGGANNSMAVIDLFSANELAELRANNWLINDAALTFTIDKATMNIGDKKAVEPNRLYLYDLNNRRFIADYYLDESVNSTKPKFSKKTFGGIIQKDADGRGTRYKFRLTKHILQLASHPDSTNVRLGLVVTEDISNTTNKRVKTAVNGIKVVPLMSAVHPLGTVLHGSSDPDESKRPKFEIYYTKPKQN